MQEARREERGRTAPGNPVRRSGVDGFRQRHRGLFDHRRTEPPQHAAKPRAVHIPCTCSAASMRRVVLGNGFPYGRHQVVIVLDAKHPDIRDRWSEPRVGFGQIHNGKNA